MLLDGAGAKFPRPHWAGSEVRATLPCLFFPRRHETKRTLVLSALGPALGRVGSGRGAPSAGAPSVQAGPVCRSHTEARPHQSQVQQVHTGSAWPTPDSPGGVSSCCPGGQALAGLDLVQAAFPSRPEDSCDGGERCS